MRYSAPVRQFLCRTCPPICVEDLTGGKAKHPCLTETHAIEFDFGSSWAEVVGESAYYALQTERKAGIVLILETITDRKYWIRLNTTIECFALPIDTRNVGEAAY